MSGPRIRRARTRRIVVTAAGVILLAGCGGASWSAQFGAVASRPGATAATKPGVTPSNWVAFHDPSEVSFRHPAAWTVQPGQLGPLYVYLAPTADLAGFRPNISVLVQPVPAGFTPAGYLRVSLAQMPSLGAKLESQGPATLGGLPGAQITWSIVKSGLSIRFLSVWTVRATQAFVVTYTADDAGFAAPLAQVRLLIGSMTLPVA